MSRAGPAAALAVKSRTQLMAGDMDVTETVRAGQRQTQRSSPGSYDFVAMQTATTSLPAQPSLVRPGRQVQPPLAPIFSQDTSTSSSTRRSRGRPRKEGGQYQCDKCGQCLSSKQALKRHLAEYTITARDGQTKTELLCAKSLATEWNHQVDVMLSECASESQRKDVKTQYGYLGEKDAQRHADRLQLRVEQTRHAGSLGSEIQDFCSRIKELSIAIPEVELQTELRTSMARGVGGPAANTHHPSALQLPTKRASDEVEDLSNHCFQCSTIGRPLSECCIKDKSTRRPTFINGHSGHRRTVVCSFFDDKFPEGHVERATRVHRAAKDRAAAMQRFRRRKSKQAKRTPQTSPRIEEFV